MGQIKPDPGAGNDNPTPTRMTQAQLAGVISEQVEAGLKPIKEGLESLQHGPPGTDQKWSQLVGAASGDPTPAAPANPSEYAAGEPRGLYHPSQLNWNLGVSRSVRESAAVTPAAYRATAAPPPRGQLFPGQAMAQFVRSLTASQRSMKNMEGYVSPLQMAARLYGEEHYVTKALDNVVKMAVDSTGASKGAILIPPGFTSDFIELLRPATVFLSAGPQYVSNPTGNLPIPKQVSGASAGYITEGDPIPLSQASFGQETAISKIIGAITMISNFWLDRADAGADQMIVNDLVAAVSQKLDQAALRSTGGGGEPKGLRYWAHSGNVIAAENPAGGDAAEVVAQKVENTYQKLWLKLAANNIGITRPHIFLAARTFSFLNGLRDGNGNKIYSDDLSRGMWGQIPVSWSNQMPVDLGPGTESEIILANMTDVVFADEQSVSVVVDDKAVQDGATVKAPFSLNQSAVRVLAAHDVITRYSKAIAVAKGCTWGTV